jgi:hypothetical protein
MNVQKMILLSFVLLIVTLVPATQRIIVGEVFTETW